jgi:hypothetical protein
MKWETPDLVFDDRAARSLMKLPICRPPSEAGDTWCTVFRKMSPATRASFYEYLQSSPSLSKTFEEASFHFSALGNPGGEGWTNVKPDDIVENLWLDTPSIDSVFTTRDGRRFVSCSGVFYTVLEFEHLYGETVLDYLDSELTPRVATYRRAMAVARETLPVQFEVQVSTDNLMFSTETFFAYSEESARAYLARRRLHVIDITSNEEVEFRNGHYQPKGT